MTDLHAFRDLEDSLLGGSDAYTTQLAHHVYALSRLHRMAAVNDRLDSMPAVNV